jgi:hypothetical protein
MTTSREFADSTSARQIARLMTRRDRVTGNCSVPYFELVRITKHVRVSNYVEKVQASHRLTQSPTTNVDSALKVSTTPGINIADVGLETIPIIHWQNGNVHKDAEIITAQSCRNHSF